MSIKKILQIIVVLIVVVIMVNIVRTTMKTIESGRRVQSLEMEIADLQQQNSRLRRVLADRNTSAFVEMVARNKLNYMRPGESLYIVVGDEKEASAEEEIMTQFESMTPLQQWQLLLFSVL